MGTYYDEGLMAERRKALEKAITPWADVTKKVMFGCPAYRASGNLFAVLLTDAVVITRLDASERASVAGTFQGSPFHAGGRVIDKWIMIRVREPRDIVPLIPWIERSYRSAMRGT